jgi:hypothetical protein
MIVRTCPASAAYRALKPSGRRALHLIEDALSRSGDGAAVSLNRFLELGLCRTAARYGIRQCERLGFITVGVGARRVRVFRMADGWKFLDADEAKQRMALAREPMQRAVSKPVTVEPPKVEALPKPVQVERTRGIERRVTVSLPRLSFMDDGR